MSRSGFKRVTVQQVLDVIEMRKRGMKLVEIGYALNLHESTVSRILKEKEKYLYGNLTPSAVEYNKHIGLQCYDCEVFFIEPNGNPCLCNSCAKRRRDLISYYKRTGFSDFDESERNEIIGDVEKYIKNPLPVTSVPEVEVDGCVKVA